MSSTRSQSLMMSNASAESATAEKIENEEKTLEVLKAIKNDDIVKLEELIQGGAPVNYAYKDQITPLGAAAFEGNISMVEILLKHSAVATQTFSGGKDAAWMAIDKHRYDIFDLLAKQGLNRPLRLSGTFETRLMSAVKNSDVRMVKRLLDLKFNVQDSDIDGRTALHYNLSKNPYEEDDRQIGVMLLAEGCDPNRVDKVGLAAHGLIKDERAFALLANHSLDKLNENAVKITEEREKAKKLKEQEKATPKEKPKFQPKGKRPNVERGRRYRPK